MLRARYLTLLDRIRASYWFIPSLMTAGAIGLSFLTTMLDGMADPKIHDGWGTLYSGGPEGARELFGTVAGSMITVAGVTFSITMVTLALASQQFGPRILYNFMRDRGNQLVLGTYVATFVYCLLMLRTVRAGEETMFVPHVSATVAVVLGVAGLGVLIFFIHHVSTSIQVASIITMVGNDLDQSIDYLFPQQMGHGTHTVGLLRPDNDEVPEAFSTEAIALRSRRVGYLQMVEDDRLLKAAMRHNLIIRLEQRPGKFIADDTVLAWVWPPERIHSRMIDIIHQCLVVGEQRTKLQDAEFSIRQLVEVAVRALSPGINDPTTAAMCVDRLGASLTRLASREVPVRYRYDRKGKLRVITDAPSFRGLIDAAFHEIRQYGGTCVPVVIRLLEVIGRIGEKVTTDEQRDALVRHAIMIERASHVVPEELDRADIQAAFVETMRTLRRDTGPVELTLPAEDNRQIG